ncbi:MAG TPA: aromatic ring-hydroxylating dioxygenase subunit alpha [Phototrophicaceae bacterium]|nr:aromatic ring-hydroxylating dioxygenase subunit alpha [Phototrophicaceae bacterium]
MIPNQWYAILESNEVKPGQRIAVKRMGENMVVWRNTHGEVACMRDLCPHRGVALSVGKVLGDHIECPFHGFQFDTKGRCQLIPANGKDAPIPKAFQVATYPTCELHGFIFIWWGEAREQLPPVRYFDAIDDTFSYSTIRDHWPTHYSRAIENQLDVVHLPFVHRTTIGRGGKTLVNGPITAWDEREENLLNLWVSNQVDEGKPPLKPAEMAQPDRHPGLQFRFPNLWHNWISDDIRVTAAFVPVDDENMQFYIRFYQRFVTTPVLREAVNWLMRSANWMIERQDRWVVITQQPKRSDLKMGEKLIQGDAPIIEYRRRRYELIEAAGENDNLT